MRKRARAPNAPLGRTEAAHLCGPRGPAHVTRPAERKRRGCGLAAAGVWCLPRPQLQQLQLPRVWRSAALDPGGASVNGMRVSGRSPLF